MKLTIACSALVLLSACALAPDLRETQLKGKATTQVAGDFIYSVRGSRKPNAILCMAGLEAPSKGHWNNLEVIYIAEHYSLCNSSQDRGEERIGVGLIWRPFK